MASMTLFLLILIPCIFAFLITFLMLKRWIIIAHSIGYVGVDMNKYEKPKVAEPGGPFVVLGIVTGIFLYLFIEQYFLKNIHNLIEILAVLVVVLLAGYLGVFDDLLGWKKGLKPWQKPLFTLPFAVPIVVLKLGETKMALPFIGTIDFGILYPLLLVPIGIMGTANGFNMIAGYNGLEAVMAILLFSGIAIKSFLIGKYYITIISLITISSILAFLYFNKYPARIFPGDSFTHPIGALYGSLIIIGNMEKFGIILFSLYFLEALLFLRGLKEGIYKENFGIPDENNCLKPPYKKIYSLTHLPLFLLRKIKKCVKETDVILFLAMMQLLVLAAALTV